MAQLDPDMGELVPDAMRGLGIDLLTGAAVREIEIDADGRVRAVHTAAGQLAADLVVLGLGVRPNVALAARGRHPARRRPAAIAVDRPHAQPVAPEVWAAGDCVESIHRLSGQRVHVALGTHANKQGRVAGINIGGGYATFPGVIGTAVTKVCDLEVARTGLSRGEAEAAGLRLRHRGRSTRRPGPATSRAPRRSRSS